MAVLWVPVGGNRIEAGRVVETHVEPFSDSEPAFQQGFASFLSQASTVARCDPVAQPRCLAAANIAWDAAPHNFSLPWIMYPARNSRSAWARRVMAISRCSSAVVERGVMETFRPRCRQLPSPLSVRRVLDGEVAEGHAAAEFAAGLVADAVVVGCGASAGVEAGDGVATQMQDLGVLIGHQAS